jgi:hypothetical protein
MSTHHPSVNPAVPTSDALARPCASKEPVAEAEDETVVITPWAFLRSVWAITWGAFRHPFMTTVVDLSTGEGVQIYGWRDDPP